MIIWFAVMWHGGDVKGGANGRRLMRVDIDNTGFFEKFLCEFLTAARRQKIASCFILNWRSEIQ